MPSWDFPKKKLDSTLKIADVYFPLMGATLIHYFVSIGDVQKLQKYFTLYQGAITEDINN